MSKPVIMELGNRGVISDPNTLLRKAFILAFLANQSQSVLHAEAVASIQYVASVYGSNPTEFATALEGELQRYLRRFFPESVTVRVSERDPGARTQYTLDIAVQVTAEGKAYYLNDALYRDNNSDITRLNSAIV